MANNYLVIRIATKQDGSVAVPVQPFEDGIPAEKEYYRLCGLSIDSANIMDAVVFMTTRGDTIEKKFFDHVNQEEPEETEE